MKNSRAGFTLMELMVTLGIGIVVMAAAYGIYISQAKTYITVEDETQSLQSARITIDQISRELRMAGFGVVGLEKFTDAKSTSVTFRGDVDSDVSTVLSTAVAPDALEIAVDLNDTKDSVDPGDYVFLHSGSDVEMLAVADTDEPADMEGEPDRILLSDPVKLAHPANTTIVKTIETITYTYDFANQSLERNGVVIARNVSDLTIHYFNDNNSEMTPESLDTLTTAQRAAIRRIEISVSTQSIESENKTKNYSISVELRNMGTRSFKADMCAPNPPASVSVAHSSCGGMDMSWTPPTTNSCDGSAATDLGGYKVYYGEQNQDPYAPAFNVADGAADEFRVEDVRIENGKTYYAQMTAYDSSFNESEKSSLVTFTVDDQDRPAPPESVDATAGVGVVNLTWNASPDKDVVGYRVYRSTQASFTPSQDNMLADENTLSETTLAYTDQTATACLVYHYRVAAVDCVGEGEASPEVYGDGDGDSADAPTDGVTDTSASESSPSPPNSASAFSATGLDRKIRLRWTNPSATDFQHVVIRVGSGSSPGSMQQGEEVAVVDGAPGAAGTYDHEGLTNGVTYYYSAWACDYCGNCSSAATARAAPGVAYPVVSITSPNEGATITDGKLLFQARGYDADEMNLSSPPSVDADNGKGIYAMTFTVSPSPGVGQFPRTELVKEYCGFSGDTNPCPLGDIANWCSGTYNLSVTAIDNEGSSATSPYRAITVANGEVVKDDAVPVSGSGTYKQIVAYGLKNTTSATATIRSIHVSWDRSTARLAAVRIPSSTTIWTPSGAAPSSPTDISLATGSRPTIGAGATSTVQFEFKRNSTTLAYGAAGGNTTITLASASGISVGNVVYIGSSTVESRTVSSLSGSTVTLSTPLTSSHSSGERVGITSDDSDMNMSGASLSVSFGYEVTITGRECSGTAMSVVVSAAPALDTAVQDQPAEGTPMTTELAQIQVPEYRSVPIHVHATDYSGTGFNYVKAYYKVDASKGSTAPSSGYATVTLSYSSSNGYWAGTVPSSSNARVWVYFEAKDNMNATVRLPSTGAYTYDFATDNTAPSCPLGLVATKIATKDVLLQWSPNTEDDIAGYNIFRQHNCGNFSKKYTLVSDADPSSTEVVDYHDNFSGMNADSNCYGYYIQAQDLSGNGSTSCEVYVSSAGDCPCH